MFILLIPIALAAIVFLCWLSFTLVVFALPFLIGLNTTIWAYHSGAGWLGAILVGLTAAGFTLGIGQILIVVVRPLWMKFAIAAVFVAPAAIAGYHVVHGIVKHAMPSETWQIVFSVIGAIAVGFTAFLRVAGMAEAGASGRTL